MIWKINQWQFKPDKQLLEEGANKLQLEPIQTDVLLYLCKNSQKIVSRDELLEHVWQGHLVTENAINKVIAKLRKALGDNNKSRSFIVTHPKKGYKLIADTALLNSTQQTKGTVGLNPNIRNLVILIILLILSYFVWHKSNDDPYYTKAIALTRSGGAEYDPAISPDGRFLVYSAFEEGVLNLYLKDLNNEQQILISDGKGNAGGGSWSFDGQQLIYLYTHKNLCEFRLLKINSGQVQNEKRVHNCPLNSFGSVAFTHDNNLIVYSEKSHPNAPYFLFSMDLTTTVKKKLNQPPVFLAGNAEFDVHPLENKILISAPDEQQWLAFYQLNLDTEELKYLFKKNEHLCCAIWSHSGDNVVTMSPHPSNGIMQMNLQGKQVKNIYESIHYVRKPIRVQHDKTYMYSGGIDNYDINFYGLNKNDTSTIADSSDTDELPRLSSDGISLAFLSSRSGVSQIWKMNLETGSTIPITKFTDNAKYYDFQWSPNGEHIAALLINGIKLIESESGDSSLLKLPQQELRGMSWFDDQTVAFSQKVNEKWRVHHYNINSASIQLADQNWAYIKYSKDQQYSAYIDHNNQLIIDNHKFELDETSRLMLYRRFGFQVEAGAVFHYRQEKRNFVLYQTDMNTLQSKRLVTLDYNGFSVGDQGVFYSQLTNRSADIFKILW